MTIFFRIIKKRSLVNIFLVVHVGLHLFENFQTAIYECTQDSWASGLVAMIVLGATKIFSLLGAMAQVAHVKARH
jgi:hypothetical protein